MCFWEEEKMDKENILDGKTEEPSIRSKTNAFVVMQRTIDACCCNSTFQNSHVTAACVCNTDSVLIDRENLHAAQTTENQICFFIALVAEKERKKKKHEIIQIGFCFWNLGVFVSEREREDCLCRWLSFRLAQ